MFLKCLGKIYCKAKIQRSCPDAATWEKKNRKINVALAPKQTKDVYCNFLPGRQFNYEDALTIMQDEEYLEDVDFDDIKRYDVFQKIDSFNANYKTFTKQNHQRASITYHYDEESVFNHNKRGKQLEQREHQKIKNEPFFAYSYQLLSRLKRGGRFKCY